MSPHICRGISSGARPRGRAAYRHGRVDADHIALLDQQLARLVAQLAHLVLRDRPTGAQLLDRLVEVAAADAHCGGACVGGQPCSGGAAPCASVSRSLASRRVAALSYRGAGARDVSVEEWRGPSNSGRSTGAVRVKCRQASPSQPVSPCNLAQRQSDVVAPASSWHALATAAGDRAPAGRRDPRLTLAPSSLDHQKSITTSPARPLHPHRPSPRSRHLNWPRTARDDPEPHAPTDRRRVMPRPA
ncbi:hypothetical protein SVAN01_03966 [Stagonosporopsis vannaccii]|nr:hypothetical protein SVAN01_03966 [Stagonosporopsis vannaccii]